MGKRVESFLGLMCYTSRIVKAECSAIEAVLYKLIESVYQRLLNGLQCAEVGVCSDLKFKC